MKKPGPPDPDFESRIRVSFARQGLMETISAKLVKVAPGEAEIELPYSKALTQQHGFVHAGIVSTLADNACGYAAYSLMPADSDILGVENKINFLAPAKGERFVGIGRVIRAGRTLAVCSGEVWAYNSGEKTLVAVMQSTLMTVAKQA
ncbi:MAG TPA: PaaI family thioesterase [Syntrophales bacterium]|nr:PaaI family thioesterase [Syntrophales bacterium]